jgi:hypothetical protein
VKDIRRQTRRQYSAEEKILVVLEGLRGGEHQAQLARHEGTRRTVQLGLGEATMRCSCSDLHDRPLTVPINLYRRRHSQSPASLLAGSIVTATDVTAAHQPICFAAKFRSAALHSASDRV